MPTLSSTMRATLILMGALALSTVWGIMYMEFDYDYYLYIVLAEKLILISVFAYRLSHTSNWGFWLRVAVTTAAMTVTWILPYLFDYSRTLLIICTLLYNYAIVSASGALISLRRPTASQYLRSITPLALFVWVITIARILAPRDVVPAFTWQISYLSYFIIVTIIIAEMVISSRIFNLALILSSVAFALNIFAIRVGYNPIAVMDQLPQFTTDPRSFGAGLTLYSAIGFIISASALMPDARILGQASRFSVSRNEPSGWTVELSVIFVPLIMLLSGDLHPVYARFLGIGGLLTGFLVLAQISRLRSSIRDANDELELRVTRDTLTGTNNRKGFMDQLNAVDRKTTLFLLFLDLDKFKPVNDTYGHQAGDIVLQVVAQRIQAAIPRDAIMCRWGGDEFLAIGRYDEDNPPEDIRDDIMLSVAHPIVIQSNTTVVVGVTIGISTITANESILASIREADLEMYERKRGSKHRTGV